MKTLAQDDIRWGLIMARAPGDFVFGVKTTGIYCRPSCPARHARRENIRFFETWDEAENAGFRACKRCRPEMGVKHPHTKAIEDACDWIKNAEDEPSLAQLSAQADLSPAHFQRLFKNHLGLSPKEYAKAVRKKRLQDNLRQENSVTQAIYAAGYNSASRAYHDTKHLGLTPKALKSGPVGDIISYTLANSSLGPIILAFTVKGLCLLEFLSEGEPPLILLQSRFPKAILEDIQDNMASQVQDIIDQLEQSRCNPHLALDIRGTVFQEKIWQALRTIPKGETRSYSEIARAVGAPKAARAVAKACASNTIAVLIPCHRIIRENGDISGYKWGVDRKVKLLKREQG